MKRRDFMSGLAASAALGGQAQAQDYVASVISQLERMGFRGIRQERTLLGRVRIVATRSDGRREIIINPNNGEILRDLWSPVRADRGTTVLDDKSGGGNRPRSGGNDDDDDDDDGGGSGGDSGGSGGGGSGGGGSGGGDDDDDDDGGDDDDDDDGGDDDDDGD